MLEVVGLSYPTVWNMMQEGNFPQAVLINPTTKNGPIAWKEADLEAWIASRPYGKGRYIPPWRAQRAKAAAAAPPKKLMVRPGEDFPRKGIGSRPDV